MKFTNEYVLNAVAKDVSKKDKDIVVKVPAGVDEESQLRLTGKGEAGHNGGPQR